MKKLMMAAVMAAMATVATAGTPTSFAYQGVLRDEAGAPLKQEQATITFRLYNSNEKEAEVLWQKELNLAIDTNGLFNAELSGGNLAEVIADSEAKGQSLYVGLTVKDSAGEISPRQKMIATPLAAFAQNVAKADKDFTVKGSATFEGAVSMNGADNVFNASNVRTSGKLDVTGAATLNGGTEMNGNVKMTGEMTVSGNGTLVIEGAQMSLPIGVIMMWAGEASEIPTNCWALCDGKTTYKFNGKDRKVPDLRGRFIVGVGSYTDTEGNGATYESGSNGGLNKHTLTTDEMPKHNHLKNPDKHWYRCGAEKGYNDNAAWPTINGDIGSGDWNEYFTTDYAGGDKAHENRPPYYALCYIIKIK